MELLFRNDKSDIFFYCSFPVSNKFLCLVISSRVLGNSNLGAFGALYTPGSGKFKKFPIDGNKFFGLSISILKMCIILMILNFCKISQIYIFH